MNNTETLVLYLRIYVQQIEPPPRSSDMYNSNINQSNHFSTFQKLIKYVNTLTVLFSCTYTMLFKISHFQDNERARFCVMLFLYTVDMTVNEMKEYRNHDIYVSSIVCFFVQIEGFRQHKSN